MPRRASARKAADLTDFSWRNILQDGCFVCFAAGCVCFSDQEVYFIFIELPSWGAIRRNLPFVPTSLPASHVSQKGWAPSLCVPRHGGGLRGNEHSSEPRKPTEVPEENGAGEFLAT